jgi:hypothetical protein
MKHIAIAMATVLALSSVNIGTAEAGIMQWTDDFEYGGNGGWWFAGNAGIDHNRGLAHRGQNNGWIRNWTGWNAINTSVSTRAGRPCTVVAWIRTSDTLTDGYMTIRSWRDGLPIIREIKLGAGPSNPAHGNYNQYRFDFIADSDRALFYVGLQGNGRDSWIQVDDVVVQCTTPF